MQCLENSGNSSGELISGGRRQVSASVFLGAGELEQLRHLAKEGADIEARGVPSDRPIGMEEIGQRYEKGSA